MSKPKRIINQGDFRIRPAKSRQSEIWVRGLAGTALIAVLVFIVYYPSLNGEFIDDDYYLLTYNPLIKAPDGLYKIWCSTEAIDYWPVTNTVLWIQWRLWETNPGAYRVFNLILHIVEALLIWLILRKLAIPGAFLAAVIFSVHPVNVESVAWISQLKNLLAMLFFLLAILWYLKFEISSPTDHCSLPQPANAGRSPTVPRPPPTVHHPLYYWLSLAAFILAMLSKGSVAVLPLLLLLIVWWLRTGTVPIFASTKMGLSPSVWRWDLLRLAPFFLVAVVLAAVNVWFQTHGLEISFRTASFTERLLGACGVVWFYLYKALLPLDLAFIYPQWRIQTGNLLWWLPLLSVLTVTALLWQYRNTWARPVLFAWGFFCVALVPVMGFADVALMKYTLVADHYQHIAIIGIIVLLTAGWNAWRQGSSGSNRLASITVAFLTVGALAFLTWRQSGYYHDEITLWENMLQKNSNLWVVHNGLGEALAKKDQNKESIEHYQQALELNPDYLEAHYNLGLAFFKINQYLEAIQQYQEALKLRPNSVKVRLDLARAYDKMNRPSEALATAQKAWELAQSSGRTTLAKQIENSLKLYRAHLNAPPPTPPPSKAAIPK